jgi:hypothetical protein
VVSTIGSGPKSLSDVVGQFIAEADQIESVFYASTGMNRVTEFTIPYAPAEDGCLVSLWDAWNRFVRRLCLTSCAGGVEGLSGTRYTPTTARSEANALTHIRGNSKGTKIRVVGGEPYWFDATAIADLTAVLGLSNANQIVGAITASHIQLGPFTIPNPLEDVRVCRNFIAHKGDGTLTQVRAVAGAAFTDLCQHVRSKRYGVELFSDWKESCRSIAIAAAQ